MGPCVHYICEMINELADIAVFPTLLLDSSQMAPNGIYSSRMATNGIKNDVLWRTRELPLE
jgi:hypothetical protein